MHQSNSRSTSSLRRSQSLGDFGSDQGDFAHLKVNELVDGAILRIRPTSGLTTMSSHCNQLQDWEHT